MLPPADLLRVRLVCKDFSCEPDVRHALADAVKANKPLLRALLAKLCRVPSPPEALGWRLSVLQGACAADLRAPMPVYNKYGEPPAISIRGIRLHLSVASHEGLGDVISWLFATGLTGADIAADNFVAIRHAACQGHLGVVRDLLGRVGDNPAAREAAVLGACFSRLEPAPIEQLWAAGVATPDALRANQGLAIHYLLNDAPLAAAQNICGAAGLGVQEILGIGSRNLERALHCSESRARWIGSRCGGAAVLEYVRDHPDRFPGVCASNLGSARWLWSLGLTRPDALRSCLGGRHRGAFDFLCCQRRAEAAQWLVLAAGLSRGYVLESFWAACHRGATPTVLFMLEAALVSPAEAVAYTAACRTCSNPDCRGRLVSAFDIACGTNRLLAEKLWAQLRAHVTGAWPPVDFVAFNAFLDRAIGTAGRHGNLAVARWLRPLKWYPARPAEWRRKR